MKSTPLLSDLELALIGLIREQPRSGYVLRKAIADFPQFSDSPGAIYPALRRLKKAGLIEANADVGGRKTEVFRVTAAGRRALRATLEAPPTQSESTDRQMLRFAFLDLELDTAAVADFLQRCADIAHERAVVLRGRRASTLRDSARLAFDHEVEVLVARAKWAEREAKRLKR
ncbi:MAG TPA: helix-turn-helix transcriptional regulator [Thermoanaerobaculia bacterium]|nr:helix-turn-helix transcriptional regulator [Thermoanaerobaculia bacterium]